MNGPEHYAEAERLAKLANSVDWQGGSPHRPNRAEYAQTVLALAQVHATLALVAAASESTYRAGDRERWAQVLAGKDES